MSCHRLYSIPVVQKSLAPGMHGQLNFVRLHLILWLLSIQLAACHPSGSENFAVTSIFLERLCSPVEVVFDRQFT